MSGPTGMAASKTAAFVAFYRALESSERGRAPLFRDPFAAAFIPRDLRYGLLAAAFGPLRVLLLRYADWRAPGARTSAIGRTRFIDDEVRRAVARGVGQLVILGAGFDCRAHRMPELASVRVFEVDQTDTQRVKRHRLGSISAAEPPLHPGVAYVGVDFERDDLSERLVASGWDPAQSALFLWEGVTNYLTETAVGEVLAFLGRAARGSTVVFTYIHRGLLEGRVQFEGGEKLMRNVRHLGEPWRFGLYPEQVAAFVGRFDLELRESLGADEYRHRYFQGAQALRGYAFYRVAVADVARGTSGPPAPSQ